MKKWMLTIKTKLSSAIKKYVQFHMEAFSHEYNQNRND